MWTHPEIYDIEHAHSTEDLVFWEGIVDVWAPARVLELACGTGRVLLPLAAHCCEHGKKVEFVGLDTSAEYLACARVKAERLSLLSENLVFLEEGDMREFALEGKFDVIYVAFNSFSLLLSIDEQMACLQCVKKHLSDRGRLVLDINTPPPRARVWDGESSGPALFLFNDMPVPDLGISRFVQYSAFDYDPIAQTLYRHSNKIIERFNGEQMQVWDGFRSHVFFHRELELLFSLAALNVVAKYGDYGMGPCIPGTKTILWVLN